MLMKTMSKMAIFTGTLQSWWWNYVNIYHIRTKSGKTSLQKTWETYGNILLQRYDICKQTFNTTCNNVRITTLPWDLALDQPGRQKAKCNEGHKIYTNLKNTSSTAMSERNTTWAFTSSFGVTTWSFRARLWSYKMNQHDRNYNCRSFLEWLDFPHSCCITASKYLVWKYLKTILHIAIKWSLQIQVLQQYPQHKPGNPKGVLHPPPKPSPKWNEPRHRSPNLL